MRHELPLVTAALIHADVAHRVVPRSRRSNFDSPVRQRNVPMYLDVNGGERPGNKVAGLGEVGKRLSFISDRARGMGEPEVVSKRGFQERCVGALKSRFNLALECFDRVDVRRLIAATCS